MKVEHNISRIRYLLGLYKISEADFLELISKGLTKGLKKNDVFSKEININTLKRIDKIFNKGLSYYVDPQELPKNKDASIFFRKREFNSELNLKSKKIVNEFEDFKLSLSAIAKLSDIDLKRTLPILSPSNNARSEAIKFRGIISPKFQPSQKDFLTSLINKLAEFNILVLEFVETWNQKERANIDGVFLNPNVIVLKRQEGASFRREIFTLIHEFAHYILNIEEVERLDYEILAKKNMSGIEQWCNDFAFHFLIGNYESEFIGLSFSNSKNDYNHDKISYLSHNTHLSEIALYTRLLFDNKISHPSYKQVKNEYELKAKAHYEDVKRKRELEKESGKEQRGSTPKPIKSDLLISTVQAAFYEGIIDEYQVCKTLKISPDKIANYIQ